MEKGRAAFIRGHEEAEVKKIKKFLLNKYTLIACKIIIGFIFIIASVGKIADPHGFARDVYSYALLPDILVPAFAAVVPWIEFIAGILLLLDIKPQSNALIINALLVMFIGAILVDMARGVEISCGCFDFLFPEEEIGWRTVVRDLLMFVPAVIILFFDSNGVNIYGLWRKERK